MIRKRQKETDALNDYKLRLQILKNEGKTNNIDISAFHAKQIKNVEKEKAKNFGVFYNGEDLPAPFHKGIFVTNIISMHCLMKSDADKAIQNINHLKENLGKACDILRKISDAVTKAIDENNVKLISWQPIKYEYSSPSGIRIASQITVEIATAKHQLKEMTYWVESNGKNIFSRYLMKDLNCQKERQEAINGYYKTDEVMARMLKKLDSQSSKNLRDIILKADHKAYKNFFPRNATWTKRSLGDHKIKLPDNIETIRLHDNKIVGRCIISPEISWNSHTLRYKNAVFPETVIKNLTGKKITAFINHPIIGKDMTIIDAKITANGCLVIKCDPKMIGYPQYGKTK